MQDITVTFQDEYLLLVELFPKRQQFVKKALEDAVSIFHNLSNLETEKQTYTLFEKNWIRRCAEYLIKKSSYIGLSSYSENGYKLSFLTGYLPNEFLLEITPNMTVIK